MGYVDYADAVLVGCSRYSNFVSRTLRMNMFSNPDTARVTTPLICRHVRILRYDHCFLRASLPRQIVPTWKMAASSWSSKLRALALVSREVSRVDFPNAGGAQVRRFFPGVICPLGTEAHANMTPPSSSAFSRPLHNPQLSRMSNTSAVKASLP